MDWRHRAACRDEDPELFFPVGNTGPALRQIAEAKAVCWRCPVVSVCLTWALDSGQDAGVWGGMSEDERHELKRVKANARTVTEREAKLAAQEAVAELPHGTASGLRLHELADEPPCGPCDTLLTNLRATGQLDPTGTAADVGDVSMVDTLFDAINPVPVHRRSVSPLRPGQEPRVDLDEVKHLRDCGLSDVEIATRFGVTVASIQRAETRATTGKR